MRTVALGMRDAVSKGSANFRSSRKSIPDRAEAVRPVWVRGTGLRGSHHLINFDADSAEQAARRLTMVPLEDSSSSRKGRRRAFSSCLRQTCDKNEFQVTYPVVTAIRLAEFSDDTAREIEL